jgi:hypothetical protein
VVRDLLYLPAGTAHQTDARGHSLSLTVACWPPRPAASARPRAVDSRG